MKLKERLPQEVIGLIYEYDDTYRRQYDIVIKHLERFLWWKQMIDDLLIGDAIVYENKLMYP